MIVIKASIFLLFLLFSSIGWGRIFFSITKSKSYQNDLPNIVYPVLGFGIIAYLSLIAGLFGFFYLIILLLIYLLGFLFSIRHIPQYVKKLLKILPGIKDVDDREYKFLLTILFFALTIIFIKTLVPPANINDSLGYHLYCPKIFLQHHRIFSIPYNVDCALPFFMEMLFAFGVSLREPIFSGLVSYLMGGLVVFAIFDFSKKYISRKNSLLASLIFLLTPVVYVHMSYAYVELGLALYLLMAFYMFDEWLREQKMLFLILAGIFMGFSLSIKTLAGFLLPAFILYIIIHGARERMKISNIIKYIFIFCLFSFIFSFIWYLRSYLIFKNPLFPYLTSFFNKGGLESLGDFSHFNLGRGTDLVSFLRLPWDLTFYPSMFAQGRIHPIFLGILPLIYLGLKNRNFLPIMFFVIIYLVFWFFTLQCSRFLIPILPFVCYGVCLLVEIFNSRVENVFRKTLVFFIFFFLLAEAIALLYNTRDRFTVALGLETYDNYLMREERTYPIAKYINKNLPINAKILACEARLFYFDREMIREDIFRIYTNYDSKGFTYEELINFLKEKKFSHVLLDNDSLFLPLTLISQKNKSPIYSDIKYSLYQL